MIAEFRKHDSRSEQVSILRMIARFGQITRRQLVELTGFSQAKISITINELKGNGLVSSAEGADSSGGRKAMLLRLNGRYGLLVGVELGGYETKATLADFSGAVLAHEKLPSPEDFADPQAVTERLMGFISAFAGKHASRRGVLKGIGVGLSGIVNRDTMTCSYFRNQKSWEGFPLKSIIEERFGVPAVMDDSSRMMAVAERTCGCCRDVDNFVLLSLGVGVGAGIFINGSLFRSAHGFGGEVGHMVIKENGPRCVCGNYGCLESFVSGYAIERRLQEALKANVYSSLMGHEKAGARVVVDHAQAGDKLAYSIITEAAEHLGIGLANIINIFSPEVIVITGGISHAGDLLLRPLEQVVRASALGSGRNTRIVVSSLDEFSASLGAARAWLTDQLERSDAYEVLVS